MDCNSISVEFALFGGWVRIMDMIRLRIARLASIEDGKLEGLFDMYMTKSGL